eukprot:11134219-Ditylum_brightwellii.AAC.1
MSTRGKCKEGINYMRTLGQGGRVVLWPAPVSWEQRGSGGHTWFWQWLHVSWSTGVGNCMLMLKETQNYSSPTHAGKNSKCPMQTSGHHNDDPAILRFLKESGNEWESYCLKLAAFTKCISKLEIQNQKNP